MKPENLILLGALCQEKYHMKPENMRIMHVDGISINSIDVGDGKGIELDKFYFTNGGETARAGYSEKYNTLILKGVE